MPMDENGNFNKVNVYGEEYSGKALYDILEQYARKGYYAHNNLQDKLKGQDIIWYIWAGPYALLSR